MEKQSEDKLKALIEEGKELSKKCPITTEGIDLSDRQERETEALCQKWFIKSCNFIQNSFGKNSSQLKMFISNFPTYRVGNLLGTAQMEKTFYYDSMSKGVSTLEAFFEMPIADKIDKLDYNNVFDILKIREEKDKVMKIKADLKFEGDINKFLLETEKLLEDAEGKFFSSPNDSIGALGEAMEKLCKAYCLSFNINTHSHVGLILHDKIVQYWKEKTGKDWVDLLYQTGVRHIIRVCSLKKHDFYQSNPLEVSYLILLGWRGYFEILRMIAEIKESTPEKESKRITQNEVKESTPEKQNAFLDFLLIPKLRTVKIPINPLSQLFIMQNRPRPVLSIGEFKPQQFSFLYKKDFDGRFIRTEIENDGRISYRESIEKSDGVRIGRVIHIIGNMLDFSNKIYRKYNYTDHVYLRIKLQNIKGFVLRTDPDRVPLQPYISESEELNIEREFLFSNGIDITPITEDVIKELCRSFGFLIEDTVVHDHVVKLLGKV
jgi:hypothetical protein